MEFRAYKEIMNEKRMKMQERLDKAINRGETICPLFALSQFLETVECIEYHCGFYNPEQRTCGLKNR
jgi:hypothetical protein